jgi:RND family efflux transporter MFP subunit
MRPALLLAALLAAAAGGARAADTVALVEVADWRPVFGAVESVKRADARVRIAGTLATLSVTEGDAVREGQEIARVTDDKIPLERAALDAGLRALDAQAAQAAIDLSRAEELRTRGAVPAAVLDEARTAADVIAATRAARQAERAVLEARAAEGAVLAPVSGRVLHVPVVQGMAVQPGETVAVIATEDFVLRTRLPERHAAFLAEGDPVRIAGRGALTGRETTQGRIARVYPELEAGEVVVDIAAEGLGDFFVGERIRLEVATGRRMALVVPPGTLDRRHGVTFARLDGAGEVVVQPGGPVDGGIEVLAGLKPGDRLVPYRN